VSKRCDTCEFWVLDDQWGEQEDVRPDNRRGGCHRNAPRPTTGDYEYYVLMALWLIAPENEDLENHWEQAYLQSSCWPCTRADDWCGEWKEKGG
jgi:hypothetical protein